MRLGAVIICLNEERNIGRCLENLRFCDEIVVVDSGSSDRTREIARQLGAKVFEREWKGYVGQRNEAISLSSSEWVLSIDADEVVSEDLKTEIIETLQAVPGRSAFLIPRKTFHFGRWIKYGGWYPNYLVRLFRRAEGCWVGNELHERWETSGAVGKMRNDILHYSFGSLAEQVARNNRYSSLGAESLRKERVRFSFLRLVSKPVSKFLETYVFKLGFRDGYPGFIISVSAAYSVFLKWAKLWEVERGGCLVATESKGLGLIVAIDGPSGSGKSTVSRSVAERLNGFLVDTGAMYRSVAYLGIMRGLKSEDELIGLAEKLEFTVERSTQTLLVDGEDLGSKLRTEEIGAEASRISKSEGVRRVLTSRQRELGIQLSQKHPVVVEGRDIGTVVFADTRHKFFVTGDTEIRARRRAEQLRQQGMENVDFEEIRSQIEQRDKQDSLRRIAPLKVAENAIVVDTTKMTIDEVVRAILDRVASR